MLFNSVHYLLFFPVVVALFFAIPFRYRWFLLLVASYYFYMCWKPEYAVILVVSTLVDYYCGKKMGGITEKAKRKPYLYLSLVTNLGVLFTFKYFNFFNESVREAFNHFNLMYEVPAFELLLPVGISFYTFQAMSYSIEVYRGSIKPEKHLGVFALYISFFPQLVAGPIERPQHLLKQFYAKHQFSYQRVTSGLKLMAWGFFKKLVVADTLAVFVNEFYSHPQDFDGLSLALATVFFAFQIYCDFSGYSDIAIGTARVMGFDFMQNFRRPYFSKSIRMFWQRWHISLSTWFRDYLYIPLGGNRVVKWRWYYNLFITFLISGFWHGAYWTFLIWGALHGLYLVIELIAKKPGQQLATITGIRRVPIVHQLLRMGITFVLVCIAWVFFRAETVNDAWTVLSTIAADGWQTIKQLGLAGMFDFSAFHADVLKIDWGIALFGLLVLLLVELLQVRKNISYWLMQQPFAFRWSIYFVLVMSILLLGKYEQQTQFIYFQF